MVSFRQAGVGIVQFCNIVSLIVNLYHKIFIGASLAKEISLRFILIMVKFHELFSPITAQYDFGFKN